MSYEVIMETTQTKMRRFYVVRKEDETGVSGTGIVAEGVVFWDGTCVIKWTTDTSSIGIYKSHVEMIHLHGHGGRTVIKWIDEKSQQEESNIDPEVEEETKTKEEEEEDKLDKVAKELQKATKMFEDIKNGVKLPPSAEAGLESVNFPPTSFSKLGDGGHGNNNVD